MSIFRRRRGHPLIESFNQAAQDDYFSDDAQTEAYYFDDALILRYVTNDA